jgi:alpha-galactosidase
MAILFDAKDRSFLLTAGGSSYAMQISPEEVLCHLYYGKPISDIALDYLRDYGRGASFCPNTADGGPTLDTLLQEYPCYGISDFRTPAADVTDDRGARALDLRYVSHEILAGQKPALPGLPATYLNAGEADTLVITLEDPLLGLRVLLYYCVFRELNIITRWAQAQNNGSAALYLNSLQSACVDFPGMEYDVLSLSGAWCRERMAEKHPLFQGITNISSRRGSTGHQLNPFAALCAKNATEEDGEVFAFQLVYSSNFSISAEVAQMHTTRVTAGINPQGFCWKLAPGEAFTAPEAVLCYSAVGLGGVSRALHRLYRNNLIRGEWKHKTRPILINSWEGSFFNFNAEKLVDYAKAARKADIDLLVMDDGWFGMRYNDTCGLGDWWVNEEKLGCTLKEMVDRINAAGLDFGIWFEPEMISPDSDLYRAHPDWALHIPNRGRSLGRKQCVINMALPEVRANLFQQISILLRSANIAYIKWDFNRNLTEIFSPDLPADQQGEVAHRYVLGLYELCERLITAFPHILFESCSGGGGRYDPGMLHYMPQTWGSDNTDPLRRLKIQHGTSICYPAESMGAHVSRARSYMTSTRYKADIAMAGTFGYELDPTSLPDETLAEWKALNDEFRELQPIIAKGDLYRLNSPYDSPVTAWNFVSPDQSEALVQCVSVITEPNTWDFRIYPRGLDPTAVYHVEADHIDLTLHGDTIMNAGLRLQKFGDFSSRNIRLRRC